MKDYSEKYRILLQTEASQENFKNSVQLLKNIISELIDEIYIEESIEINNVNEGDSKFSGVYSWSKSRMPEHSNEAGIVYECRMSMILIPSFLLANIQKIEEKTYSLVMDTISIVFHNAYFSFTENFKNTNQREELLNIFFEYTKTINDASNMFYTKGLCYLAAGMTSEALKSFESSVLSTHSDDHEFMTVLSNYWSELVERSKYEEAISFLLRLQNRILYKDFEEYQNLILETFRIQAQFSD